MDEEFLPIDQPVDIRREIVKKMIFTKLRAVASHRLPFDFDIRPSVKHVSDLFDQWIWFIPRKQVEIAALNSLRTSIVDDWLKLRAE